MPENNKCNIRVERLFNQINSIFYYGKGPTSSVQIFDYRPIRPLLLVFNLFATWSLEV